MAFDGAEDLKDPAKLWQAKGLGEGWQELGDGALTGGTGRGPSQLTCLYYSTSVM